MSGRVSERRDGCLTVTLKDTSTLDALRLQRAGRPTRGKHFTVHEYILNKASVAFWIIFIGSFIDLVVWSFFRNLNVEKNLFRIRLMSFSVFENCYERWIRLRIPYTTLLQVGSKVPPRLSPQPMVTLTLSSKARLCSTIHLLIPKSN